MTKLKTLAAIAASTLALSGVAATTASAQPWAYNHYSDSRLTISYVNSLDWKIINAARHGTISWGQAREMRAELRSVRPLAWRVENGRAQPWEARRLERVVDRIDSMTQGYAYNTPRYRPYWR